MALARLSFAVWIAAVVTAALVAKEKAPDLSLGLSGNVGWAQLIVSGAALLPTVGMLTVVESAGRPFAIIGISSASFVRGETFTSLNDETSEKSRSTKGKKAEQAAEESEPEVVKRRRTLVKKRPPSMRGKNGLEKDEPDALPKSRIERSFSVITYTADHRRVRSQPIPTPLDSIFASQPLPGAGTDSPRVKGDFAWKPPVQNVGSIPDLATLRRSGITSFDRISLQSDEMSLMAQTSVASSSSSRSSMQPTLPSIALDDEFHLRVPAISRSGVDTKRWTVAQMPSAYYDNNGVGPMPRRTRTAIPRPKSDMAAPPPIPRSMSLSLQSRYSVTSGPPPRLSMNRQSMRSIASRDSTPQPNRDSRRWTVISTQENDFENIPNVPELPRSPTIPDLTSSQNVALSRTPSMMTNFSRPRTAAAAMMKAKTSRRLEAARALGITRAEAQQEEVIDPVENLTPRPRTAAAALMQHAIERRIQAARAQAA
ncbi:hypothetical protein GQ53DRAFT_835347 [Thozetella sp. PMI_491]|nr:hypothetical protein GQ53DRAFT_835347 [Thozetella sp. PMI_491]